MKKILLGLLVGLGFAGFASSGVAASYRDTDSLGGTLVSGGNSLSGWFQIDADDADGITDRTGYNKDVEQIISATAAFLLGDDRDLASETVNILLGGELFMRGVAVSYVASWVGAGLAGDALFDLSEDGRIRYTIRARTGDFKAYTAVLRATSGPRSIAVPDGGSLLALFGIGLTGLGLAGRKLKF